MTDTFTVEIYDINGQLLSTWSDSLRDYLMRMATNELKKASPSAEKVASFVDALIYGAAAQTKFSYNVEDMADAQLTSELLAYATSDSTLEGLSNVQVKPAGMMGSTLEVADKIVLNFVFSNTAMKDCAYVKVSFVDHYGKLQENTIEKSNLAAFSTYGKIVAASKMVIADCRAEITVTLHKADGTVILTAVDSVESYISRMMDKDPALYGSVMKFSVAAYNTFH